MLPGVGEWAADQAALIVDGTMYLVQVDVDALKQSRPGEPLVGSVVAVRPLMPSRRPAQVT